MKIIQYLIFAVITCAIVICAGCTGTTSPPASPASGQASATAGLAQLALAPADVPQNFTLVSAAARNPDEVSSLARNLGWQGGYTVRYTGPVGPNGVPAEIVQSIAVYPAGAIPDLMALADRQDRSDTDLSYTNLTPGTVGAASRGFSGKAPAGLYIKPTNANPLVSGPEHHDVSTALKTDVAEILFSKGDVFEVIRMTGPGADEQAVTALAEKAYARIP